MASDWFLLGLLGSAATAVGATGAGAALSGLAGGAGAAGAGAAAGAAAPALSTVIPSAAGAGGLLGSGGAGAAAGAGAADAASVAAPSGGLAAAPTSLSTATLPQSTQVIGAGSGASAPSSGSFMDSLFGGSGQGATATQPPMLPSSPNPALQMMGYGQPGTSPASPIPFAGPDAGARMPGFPAPATTPTFVGGGTGYGGDFLHGLINGPGAGAPGSPSGGPSFMNQLGGALRTRFLSSIAGPSSQQPQQMDPSVAALLTYLRSRSPGIPPGTMS
jgi:hypothetical protein